MTKLTTAVRKKISGKNFAEEKAVVRRKVHAKYPNMGKAGVAKAHGHKAVTDWTNG